MSKTLGTWKRIGYEAPGKKGKTDVFKYTKGDLTQSIKYSNIKKALSGDGMVSWMAQNRVSLGNCLAGNQWKIKVLSISDNEIEYRPFIEQSNTSADCAPLARN